MQYVRTLPGRPGYPEWRNVSWAIFDAVGGAAGLAILKRHLPPEDAGEYEKMLDCWDPNRENKHTIATVIDYIQKRGTYINPKKRDPWMDNWKKLKQARNFA